MNPLELYLWRLFLYGLVSLMELALGYGTMKYLQDRRRLTRFWAYFYSSVVVGFIAYNLRFFVYA